MRVLVTGGAGYIGAHTCLRLRERGDDVVIVDDLVTGSATRVPGVPIVELDLTSDGAPEALATVMREHAIEAVIHFAARKQVAESVERPAWYYQQNVGGLAQLLIAMQAAGVDKLIFSSSAAVYGTADGPIHEYSALDPINPYGATKLVGEQLIAAAARADGLRAASLRYFNVGGAAVPELGDVEILNLIPITFDLLTRGERPTIFGVDYPTPDGSCVRDFVHVLDVADAHLAVLDALDDAPGHVAFNVGTGVGTSVREIVDRIIEVVGAEVSPEIAPRRPGDAAEVVAAVDRIEAATGWRARYSLADIVESAWAAWQIRGVPPRR